MTVLASEMPSVWHFAVWGPLGVMFGVGLWIFCDWYRNVQRPRLTQRARNEEAESQQRQAYIETSGKVMSQFAESHERQTGILRGIQETQEHQGEKIDEHGKRLSAIWQRLIKGDPDQEENDVRDLAGQTPENSTGGCDRGRGRRSSRVA